MVNVDVYEFKELMKNPEVVILDVRTLDEFENGFIYGAINFDIMGITFRDEILALDRDKVYLVYCRSGARSANACNFMESNGFNSVYNLDGGIVAWNNLGEKLCEEKE